MKLEHHIVASTLISAILFTSVKSWGLSIASFISGIFIDLDHVIDYVIDHGFIINLEEFLSYFYGEEHLKIRLIFHGWEWLILIIISAKLTNWNPWVTGLLIGYGHHIVLDFFYSKAPFRSYSLIWKWKKRFDSMLIYPRYRGYSPSIMSKKRR
jgi:hypothetical protein